MISMERKKERSKCVRMWVLRVKLKGEGYMHIYMHRKKSWAIFDSITHLTYIVFTYSY